MRETEDFEDDEISLFELLEKLRQTWRYVVGGVVVGVIAALAAMGSIPERYEAVALLQTGRVAGTVIEEAPTMVERLKSSSFHLELAQEIKDLNWVDQINRGGGADVLSAIMPKTTPSLVEVRVRAKSPALAVEIADKATSSLIKRHDALSAQVLKKVHFDLDVAKEKLASTEHDIQLLTKTLASTNVKDERFSQLSLLTSVKMQKDSELYNLRQAVYALEASLLPPATQPARVLEKIFVPSKPISPNKRLILTLGTLGGLLVGAMVGLVSGAWRQARERHLKSN